MARGTRSGDAGDGRADSGAPAAEFLDPDKLVGPGEVTAEPTPDSGDAPRKRGGRPRGSGAGSAAKEKAQLDLKGIETVLLSMHYMLAVSLRIPEMALSQGEAEQLAAGLGRVARHYPVLVATQQTMDWIAFIGVVGAVYGPRAVAYGARTKKAKADAAATAPMGSTVGWPDGVVPMAPSNKPA